MSSPTAPTHHFTIFTMPNCPDCANAKALLSREKQSYAERTEFTREELQALVGPVRTLPQIIVRTAEGKYHIGGYRALVAYFNGTGPEVITKID